MNKKRIFIFAVLGVLLFALGAQLATAQPVEIRLGDSTISFLPLIISSKAADGPSGVLYVFSSTATTNGDAGGRDAMNNICVSEDSEAHFCHLKEIENAWITSGVFFKSPISNSWVEYHTEGTWNIPENCMSWSSSSPVHEGSFIFEDAYREDVLTCDSNFAVSCCKWMP